MNGMQKGFLIAGGVLVILSPVVSLWLIPAGVIVGWAGTLDY